MSEIAEEYLKLADENEELHRRNKRLTEENEDLKMRYGSSGSVFSRQSLQSINEKLNAEKEVIYKDFIKSEEQNKRYKEVTEKLFNGIDEITGFNLYEDAYDTACDLLEFEKELEQSESHAPEGRNYTNAQYMELLNENERYMKALGTIEDWSVCEDSKRRRGKMDKVKLTQEQADVVYEIKKELDLKHLIMVNRCMDWAHPEFKKMSNDELGRALYVGYEVEEEFKSGDWVVSLEGHGMGFINNDITYRKMVVMEDETYFFYESEFRHAKPEEITVEKQRRWWESKGRKVWELKRNDVIRELNQSKKLTVDAFSYNRVFMEDGSSVAHEKLYNNYVVVYFAEDRQDNAQG